MSQPAVSRERKSPPSPTFRTRAAPASWWDGEEPRRAYGAKVDHRRGEGPLQVSAAGGDTLRSAIDQLPFHNARQEGTIGAVKGELRGSPVLRVIFETVA